MTIDTLDPLPPEFLELQMDQWSAVRRLAGWALAPLGIQVGLRSRHLRFEWGGGLSPKLFVAPSYSVSVWSRIRLNGFWFVAGHTFVSTSLGLLHVPASRGVSGRLRLLSRQFERHESNTSWGLRVWEGLHVLR